MVERDYDLKLKRKHPALGALVLKLAARGP